MSWFTKDDSSSCLESTYVHSQEHLALDNELYGHPRCGSFKTCLQMLWHSYHQEICIPSPWKMGGFLWPPDEQRHCLTCKSRLENTTQLLLVCPGKLALGTISRPVRSLAPQESLRWRDHMERAESKRCPRSHSSAGPAYRRLPSPGSKRVKRGRLRGDSSPSCHLTTATRETPSSNCPAESRQPSEPYEKIIINDVALVPTSLRCFFT